MMTTGKQSTLKVAILGAGCSWSCGYPLAIETRAHLAKFAAQIKVFAPKLHEVVSATLGLFEQVNSRGYPAETLDELAWQIHQGRITSERGVLKDEYEYRFVEEAKSAVAAMFLARESELAASSLRGYHKMLSAMFGEETRCDRALQQSRWRVLSFNYDRLFERAFMQRFELGSQQALYGPLRLNSGLNPLSPASVEIDKARFSLLKLHGSAGFAGAEEHGHCNVYGAEPELLKSTPVDDSTCFFGPRQGIYSNRIKPALIVFPHEKNHLKVYPNNTLPYRNYIPTVWAAAADFISQACEIQIIGYSIPRPDWPGLLQLFESAKNCERIIVKDIQPEKVCENLTELLDGFSGKIVPVRTSFE